MADYTGEIPNPKPPEDQGNRKFYDAVIVKSQARTERKYLKERSPSPDGIPFQYLLAVNSFLDNPQDADKPFEYLKGDIADPIDMRFTLETTINYLYLRNLQGKSSAEEQETVSHLRKSLAADDLGNAVEMAKSNIQGTYIQEDIEEFLPDTTEKPVRKNKLNIRQVASLAQLILRDDEHKAKDQKSSVHNNCVQILDHAGDADPYFDPHFLKDPKVRRLALRTFVEKLSDPDEINAFIDHHDPLSQKVIYYLALNPDLLVKMYLNDLDTGKPELIREGELQAQVEKALGDNPEAEFLTRHAKSIEDRMKGPLARLYDAKADDYKLSVLEYLDSEKRLNEFMEEAENDLDLVGEDQLLSATSPTEPQRPAEENGNAIKNDLDLESKIPGISSIIDLAISRHINSNFKTYDIGPLLRTFGMRYDHLNRILDERYVFAQKGPGKDYHPVFTPEQAIAISVIKRKFDEFKPEYTETLEKIIKERLDEANEIRRKRL